MRWLAHRGGAQHHRRWKRRASREPLPAAAVIGADPGTILAAVTPVPDTLSEYQFAGLLRGAQGRAGRLQDRAAEGAGAGRDRARRPCLARRLRRRRPLRRPHRLLQFGRALPGVPPVSAITMRRDPIYLSTYTGRPPDEPSILGEALNEVFIPLLQQQFPEIVDFWLPPEGCSYRIAVVSIRKAYPGHAKRVMMGGLVVPAPVHVHQMGDRRGRRHRRARLEGRDVGDLDPHGPGARHHPRREHADRLSRLRLARIGPRRQDRPRRHQQMAAGDPARMGPADPHGRGGRRGGDEKWASYGLPGSGKPIWK